MLPKEDMAVSPYNLVVLLEANITSFCGIYYGHCHTEKKEKPEAAQEFNS